MGLGRGPFLAFLEDGIGIACWVCLRMIFLIEDAFLYFCFDMTFP